MADPEQARATQLRNIEQKTGASARDWAEAARLAGVGRHGEIRAWAKAHYGLGYGDANALASAVLVASAPESRQSEDPLDQIYSGTKAHLRPIHDRLITEARGFGEFEIAPKKGYISLRRKKQFAMIGPKNAKQIELGLNLKGDFGNDRIIAQKPGGMCQFAVALSDVAEIDGAVVEALRSAYEAAG